MDTIDKKDCASPLCCAAAGLLMLAAGARAAATVPGPAEAGANGAVAVQAWSQWSYSHSLRLDTSPTGADVAGTVSGFPVLVRLVVPDFRFAGSKVRGGDLRFLGAGDASMPHHIEQWDSAGGVAARSRPVAAPRGHLLAWRRAHLPQRQAHPGRRLLSGQAGRGPPRFGRPRRR